MKIEIPQHALVLTLGPAGCGKSFFTEKHFGQAVVSSDRCRQMVSDDPTNQEASKRAFDLMHMWIEGRLAMGRLAVADATNLTAQARRGLREIAAKFKAPVIVLRFATDLDTCFRQNAGRDRFVPEHVIKTHFEQYESAREAILHEGYAAIHTVNPARSYEFEVKGGVQIARAPGFDIIGDIHGCADELRTLLTELGYTVGWINGHEGEGSSYIHPEGRKIVFVGDITDRGPENVQALRIVKLAKEGGHLSVMGNHDWKLFRAMKGNNVRVGHGLAETLAQLAQVSEAERKTFFDMLALTPFQLILKVPCMPDCVVTHAGLRRDLIGKDTNEARNFGLYGEVTGEKDENGFPVRTAEYVKGWTAGITDPMLVHGHTVVPDPNPQLRVNVVNVDQGAVFGGKLTAFRWPEASFVQVAPREVYFPKTYGSGATTDQLQEGA
jgi:protein phosphatase